MDVSKTIALGVVGLAIAYGGAADLVGWFRSRTRRRRQLRLDVSTAAGG